MYNLTTVKSILFGLRSLTLLVVVHAREWYPSQMHHHTNVTTHSESYPHRSFTAQLLIWSGLRAFVFSWPCSGLCFTSRSTLQCAEQSLGEGAPTGSSEGDGKATFLIISSLSS